MDLLALADFNLVARHGGFGARRAPRAGPRRRCRAGSPSWRPASTCACSSAGRMLKLTEEGRALHERTGPADRTRRGGGRDRLGRRDAARAVADQRAAAVLADRDGQAGGAGFALKYPEVRLEVTTDDRLVDMVEEGYDLVIRVNPALDERLVGRIVLRDRLVVVAARLARPSATDAVIPAVVRGVADQARAWDLATPAGRSTIAVEPVLRLSSLVMVRDAVRARRRRRAPAHLAGQARPGRRPPGALGRRRRARDRSLGALSLAAPAQRPRVRLPRPFKGSFSAGDSRRTGVLRRPGKEWSSDIVGDNPKAGKHWRYRIKGKVLNWEKVKVPAGEFDALKVVVDALYNGEETNSNGGSGHLTETIWFVPELNNFVKLDYHDTDWQGRIFNRDSWELMSYVHKPVATAAR
jgi:hypothetical protein